MRRSRILRSKVRHEVIVTLKSGSAFKGLLAEQDPHAWVLRQAQALGAGPNRTDVDLDGELIVLVAYIDYVQIP